MDEQRKKDLPIDRGWAWVITLACCGLFGYVSGGFKTQGVILVELQELFPDVSTESLLWVFSLTMLMNRCTGPLNGFFLAKTSHRFACCLGLLIMTASIACFGYIPKVAYMYPAYGVAYGWASGLITLSAFTAYGPYFDKKKAISVGISGAGSGLGTIFIPIILRTLFDNYSFTGAMLIYAGTAAQMLVLACLLRPISFYENLAARKKAYNNRHSSDPAEEINGTIKNKSTNGNTLSVEDEFRRRSHSHSVSKSINKNDPASKEHDNFKSTPIDLHKIAAGSSKFPEELEAKRGYILDVTRKELAYSLQDISASVSAFNLAKEEGDNNGNTDTGLPPKQAKKGDFNWRLAYHPKCIILGLAVMTYSSGLAVAYYSIPPLGKSTGVSKRLIATLLTIAGGIEIPFRIFNGWLADKNYVSAYTQLMLNMFLAGIGAITCAAVSGVAGIVVMIICCSTVGTSVYSLMPITAGELLGHENASAATSILFVYHGAASIVSTFSAGAIVEATGKWENVFFYIGACEMFASGILAVSAFFFRCVDKKNNEKMQTAKNLHVVDSSKL